MEQVKKNREKLKVKIGSNIRSARESRGISLRELSRLLLHKSPAALSNIETGKNLPDIDTIFAICKHLRVELSHILPDPQNLMMYKAKRLDIPKDYMEKDKKVQFENDPYEEIL